MKVDVTVGPRKVATACYLQCRKDTEALKRPKSLSNIHFMNGFHFREGLSTTYIHHTIISDFDDAKSRSLGPTLPIVR